LKRTDCAAVLIMCKRARRCRNLLGVDMCSLYGREKRGGMFVVCVEYWAVEMELERLSCDLVF
jgi:hypothetical protein